MKHSRLVARTLLTSFYVIASISCSKNQLDGKQLREANTKKDTQILYSRVNLPERPLKLKDIIEVAFKRNLNLLTYEQEYLIQRETAIKAQLAKLPSTTGTAEMTHRFNESGSKSASSSGPEASTFSRSSSRNTRRGDIQYLWSLLDFGVTHYRFKQAQNRFEILAQKHKRLKQNLVLELVQAYWRTVISQKAMEGAEIVLALTEKRQTDLQKQIKHRLVSEIEGLENQRRLLETQLRLKSYQRELEENKNKLLELMGLPPTTEIELAYEDLKVKRPEEVDVKKLEELSMLYRPELYSADLEEKVEIDEVRASLLSMLPNIQATGGYFYDQNKLLENNYWTQVGSKALWDILSLPDKEKSVLMAKHQVKLQKANRLNTSIGVISQVHLAYLELKDAWSQYEIAKSLYETKERLLTVGRVEQKHGVFDSADILELESETLFSEIFATTTFAEFNMALARLGNSFGDPLAFVDLDLDNLDLPYQDMVNFDLPKRQSEQWAYGKSSNGASEEFEDPYIEIAISDEEQQRREKLLASAQNRDYFEQNIATLSPEQLKHTIQYTHLFTGDEKASDRVQKLSLEQILGLRQESEKAFTSIVGGFAASQVSDLLHKDPYFFKQQEIEQLTAVQLVDLYRIAPEQLDTLMPQISPLQLASLMEGESFSKLPGAQEKVQHLTPDQLELVYTVNTELFKRIVAMLSGEQVIELIGRESTTRGLVSKWSQNNLPGIIDSDASIVALLSPTQLESISTLAPEKFERIDQFLTVDQVRGLIRETGVLDAGPRSIEIVSKVPEHTLLEVFSKDAVAFEKVIPSLNAAQLNFFVQRDNVFTNNDKAEARTAKLRASQIVQLKQLHAESFQQITQNFSGRQLLEIFAKGNEEKRKELVKVLSKKQILEIHRYDENLFASIVNDLGAEQLVDLIYNSPEFMSDPRAPAYIQTLDAKQVVELHSSSRVVFASLIPYLTEFQLLDLMRSDKDALNVSVASVETVQTDTELLAHSLSPSQLQALYFLDQDTFISLAKALNAFQLDSLLHLNTSMFKPEVVALISPEKLIELNDVNASDLSLVVPMATSTQVGSILASTELEKQSWLGEITPSQLQDLTKNQLILSRLLPYLSGKQLSAIITTDQPTPWLSYTQAQDESKNIVTLLNTKQLEALNEADPAKVDLLVKSLSRNQLLSLLTETDIFSKGAKNRLQHVSFQNIFEIFHASTTAFNKAIPQLSLEQIKKLFDDETYIDQYIDRFSAEQLSSLMANYPSEIKKVTNRLEADQIASLSVEEGMVPSKEFVSALSLEKMEAVLKKNPKAFIVLAEFLEQDKLEDLIKRDKTFVPSYADLSIAQNIKIEAVTSVLHSNPPAFESLIPHLTASQVLQVLESDALAFGQLNPADLDDEAKRVSFLSAHQLNQIKTQKIETFYRLAPFISAVQIKSLVDADPQLLQDSRLVGSLRQEQLLDLVALDGNALASFVEKLSTQQVMGILAHVDENNMNWATQLSNEQMHAVYEGDRKTFEQLLPMVSAGQLTQLFSVNANQQDRWYSKKGRAPQGILDKNESLIQILKGQQIKDLDQISSEQVDSLVPYLSSQQVQFLLSDSQVLTKDEGRRIKWLENKDLLETYLNNKTVFNQVFPQLSIAQVRELFTSRPEIREYVKKMSYVQLTQLLKDFPQEFYSSVSNIDPSQIVLLLETKELKPDTHWIAHLSIDQLNALAQKEKLSEMTPYLTAYQFEDLVLSTPLYTEDKLAGPRVQKLSSAQILQLNQKNPGAIDQFLKHLSLSQIRQLAAKSPDFLSDARVRELSAEQLEVINSQEISDSEDYISKLTNRQLASLINHDRFFTIQQDENSQRVKGLSKAHLTFLSEQHPAFLEKVMKELQFEQMQHLILTTSFLTHDDQALKRMTLLKTEQVIDLYRKMNFFKEGKRALSLLHQLKKEQLEDIAAKDPDTFSSLFASFSQEQLVDLLNSPNKVVSKQAIESLSSETVISLAQVPTASMSYPRKSYFDLILPSLSTTQIKGVFEQSSLLSEKIEQGNRLQQLKDAQLLSFAQNEPETFKEMVALLSQKQLEVLVGQSPVFTQADYAKTVTQELSESQLLQLKEQREDLLRLVIRNLSLSQLDRVYNFSQGQAKGGDWTAYLSLTQVESISRIAPRFTGEILPYLTAEQVLQLFESTQIFQNPSYKRLYVQRLSAKQLRELSELNESYFNEVITLLSNEQMSELMEISQADQRQGKRSRGFFSQLFKKPSRDSRQVAQAKGVIVENPGRIQYLTLDHLDYLYRNDQAEFWGILEHLNAYQLGQVIQSSELFKDQNTANTLANALTKDQVRELLDDNPEEFKTLIVYLNGPQLQKLVEDAHLFNGKIPTKELVGKLMLGQVEDLSKTSTKAFASILRYLSVEQTAELINKTALLTSDEQAPVYLQYLTTHQILKLRDQQSASFAKVVPVMDTRQLTALINMKNTPLTAEYLQQLSLHQLENLSVGQKKSFLSIASQFSPEQINALFASSTVFKSFKDKALFVQSLHASQLEQVGRNFPEAFAELVTHMNGAQISTLIYVTQEAKKTFIGRVLDQVSEKQMRGVIGANLAYIRALSAPQINELNKVNPDKFDSIASGFTADQLARIVDSQEIYNSAENIHRLNVWAPHQFEELASAHPQSLQKLLPFLTLEQISQLNVHTRVFTQHANAKTFVDSLVLEQMKGLSKNYPQVFDEILPNIGERLVTALIKDHATEFTPHFVLSLSFEQLKTLNQFHPDKFNQAFEYFSVSQIATFIERSDLLTQDTHAPTRVSKLSLGQLQEINAVNPKLFDAIIANLTAGQLEGIVKQNLRLMTTERIKRLSDKQLSELTILPTEFRKVRAQ